MSTTFAVATSEKSAKEFNKFMDQISIEGEKKGETLKRIFDIAAKNIDDETMKRGWVDVDALNAALDNISHLFSAATTGREQIQKSCDEKIADIRAQRDALESDLRGQIAEAKDAQQQAEEMVKSAAKAAAEATQTAESAKTQAETAEELAAEKQKTIDSRDRTIAMQAEQITAAQEKASAYDDLMQEKQAADAKIQNLKVQLRELQAQMDRAVSDAKKDAALEREKAIAEAVENMRVKKDQEHDAAMQELRDQLRKSDKEIGRLQVRIEMLEQGK